MVKKKKINPFKMSNAFWNSDKEILKEIKKQKAIIYGQRSIRKRTGLFSRPTKDYDVFSNKPKQLCTTVERKLDRQAGNKDAFFTKPAVHQGTWKLMFYGNDGIQNTKDDIGLMDATKPEGNIPYDTINGVRYRKLEEERKAKQNSLNDKAFAFRHNKDKHDLQDIKTYEKKKKDKLLVNFLIK